MSVKINFAIQDNNILHISEVKSGAKLLCPFCQKEVRAKKGLIQSHHFAHLDAENSCSEFMLFSDYSKDYLNSSIESYLKYCSNKRIRIVKKMTNGKQNDFGKLERMKTLEKEFLEKNNVSDLQKLLEIVESECFTLLENASIGNLKNQVRNKKAYEVIKQAYESNDLIINTLHYESSLKSFSSSKITDFIIIEKNAFKSEFAFYLYQKVCSKKLQWYNASYTSKDVKLPYQLGNLIALKRFIFDLDLLQKDLQLVENQLQNYIDFVEKENEWHLYFLKKQIDERFTLIKVGISQRTKERFAEIKQETSIDFELWYEVKNKGIAESWFKNYLRNWKKQPTDFFLEQNNLQVLKGKTEYFVLETDLLNFFALDINFLQSFNFPKIALPTKKKA